MTENITLDGIFNFIQLVGIVFVVYLYFKKPQIKTSEILSLIQERLNNLQGGVNKDVQTLEKQIVNLKDNHIHSLKEIIDNTNKDLGLLSIEVAKLSTIINERIPSKVKDN